ncbi:hypothetical protein AHAS_Ahas06G0219300 [Arachis hypogaea]
MGRESNGNIEQRLNQMASEEEGQAEEEAQQAPPPPLVCLKGIIFRHKSIGNN